MDTGTSYAVMYNGTYYADKLVATAAYVADDRRWLLKLAQRQRAFMEHMTHCPKRLHSTEKICRCGMSDYFVEVLS